MGMSGQAYPWGVRYSETIPPFLTRLCRTPPMERIGKVGMNCGCEYTSFPIFKGLRPYSRLDHSLGVALIVWRHTHDKAQAAAGLLHDIATPVFAHVIDFLRGDYLVQESTEDRTRTMVVDSPELLSALKLEGLSVDEVADYHLYPIADNDSPKLSADRLEYTLGNMVNYGFVPLETAQGLYDSISVGTDEQGNQELAFEDKATAEEFAFLSLRCSEVYVSDADRYAMQILSELVGDAVRSGILTEEDLYSDEPSVTARIMSDPELSAKWLSFRALGAIVYPFADTPGSRVLDAKRRRIDPLAIGHGRVSSFSPDFSEAVRSFVRKSLDYRVEGTAL